MVSLAHNTVFGQIVSLVRGELSVFSPPTPTVMELMRMVIPSNVKNIALVMQVTHYMREIHLLHYSCTSCIFQVIWQDNLNIKYSYVLVADENIIKPGTGTTDVICGTPDQVFETTTNVAPSYPAPHVSLNSWRLTCPHPQQERVHYKRGLLPTCCKPKFCSEGWTHCKFIETRALQALGKTYKKRWL